MWPYYLISTGYAVVFTAASGYGATDWQWWVFAAPVCAALGVIGAHRNAD